MGELSAEEAHDLGLKATAYAMAGLVDLDVHVRSCPCGGTLRTEVREEHRPIAQVAAMYRTTEQAIRSSGATVTAFGTIKCGVPRGVCMDCGFDHDLSATPEPQDSSSEGVS